LVNGPPMYLTGPLLERCVSPEPSQGPGRRVPY
jgi:hypothetical protein